MRKKPAKRSTADLLADASACVAALGYERARELSRPGPREAQYLDGAPCVIGGTLAAPTALHGANRQGLFRVIAAHRKLNAKPPYCALAVAELFRRGRMTQAEFMAYYREQGASGGNFPQNFGRYVAKGVIKTERDPYDREKNGTTRTWLIWGGMTEADAETPDWRPDTVIGEDSYAL